MWHERRQSERHVVELPIKYRVVDEPPKTQPSIRPCRTKNICEGGLLFLASERFETGTLLELTVPIKNQIFVIQGRVAHVDRDLNGEFYKIGIQFPRADHVFKLKLAEQLRQIHQYQQTLSQEEGRIVSEEEAARRWIDENSGMFAEFFKEN